VTTPGKRERGRLAVYYQGSVGLLCATLLLGCTAEPKPTEHTAIDPAIESHVLDSIPTDLPNPTFIDFEGKVRLIGYRVEPALAAPGSSMKLTLYWHAVSPLGPGWSLFSHVLDDTGAQIQNVDNEGPLRKLVQSPSGDEHQTLPPSAWKPGKVYVDEQEFQLKSDMTCPEVTLAVGVWRGNSRLAVISGASDGTNRGIVAHLKTGVVRQQRAAAPGS